MPKTLTWRAYDKTYYYQGNDLGVSYNVQASLFKIWSPLAESVQLVLYRTGHTEEVIAVKQLRKLEDGTWETQVVGDLEGYYYTFQVRHEGIVYVVVDPYAKAVGVNGKRGMVVDLERTNPEGWETHLRPNFDKPTDAIIYELHIRDVSSDPNSHIKQIGKFLGLTEQGTRSNEGELTGLDHIKDLGVTHVQLLPCYDFYTVDETKGDTPQYNWGYDPLHYNVPEGSYATDPYDGHVRIKEFKALIKSFHEAGIGVIMDVEYNHTCIGENSFFEHIVPDYY